MENIFKNKLNLFYLLAAILLLGIIFAIILLIVFSKPASNTSITATSPSTAPSPTLLPRPILKDTISPSKQGVFTISFAVAPPQTAFAITLAATSATNPSSVFVAVPFTTSFSNDGKLLSITTQQPVQNNTIYTLYVRLKSNNHIVVKHRYISQNGTLKIIDTD